MCLHKDDCLSTRVWILRSFAVLVSFHSVCCAVCQLAINVDGEECSHSNAFEFFVDEIRNARAYFSLYFGFYFSSRHSQTAHNNSFGECSRMKPKKKTLTHRGCNNVQWNAAIIATHNEMVQMRHLNKTQHRWSERKRERERRRKTGRKRFKRY